MSGKEGWETVQASIRRAERLQRKQERRLAKAQARRLKSVERAADIGMNPTKIGGERTG